MARARAYRPAVAAAGVDPAAEGVVHGARLPELLDPVSDLLAAHRVWGRQVPAQA